ncbi:DUF1080 domain-containing protein [Aquimarina sp. D1M17]|uniref:family 16 glycoside hydrolase n=1 Tax=Aquimarina acroporae TaxID=2937283 RepID=UPI0020C11F61|nr:family 16 glycoside hydrolase [Aquimarina acroporae]MCK8524137.1 DUF1080 domain-containing protein [Aquimarina acroporae]
MKANLLFLSLSLCAINLIFTQNTVTKIDMISSNWNLPEGASFEKFEGRNTLVLKKGRATLKNLQFTNGSIEVDIYANAKRSFGGIAFRKKENTMEEVYIRLHKSNQADAVQYTPIFNNESNWQLYREYQANVPFRNKEWNTLRIDVLDQIAVISLNNEKIMTVDQLKTDNIEGAIGVWALFGARFSNFRITQKDPSIKVNTPSVLQVADSGIIRKWNITQAFSYDVDALSYASFSKEEYTVVPTEVSGLLPISKFVKKTSSGNFEQNKENYIVAATNIHSDTASNKLFSFDYSDKIIVYLNGTPIFRGNNAFRQKGVQYTGHIDINTNTLYLPLKKGKNTLHCVVIDKANGWGLIGKIE